MWVRDVDTPLLTEDELAFIQTLQGKSSGSKGLPGSSLLLDGSVQAEALIARLAKQGQLTLEADFHSQHLTFPLRLVQDEFQTPHLEIDAPEIFEQGPTLRPWRLRLPEPIALVDEHGAETALWVHELSPNGALIEVRDQKDTPELFALWLPLPEQDPIALLGARVRKTERQLVAYRLTMGHPGHGDRLRQYIFQQHRLLHPLLHK